MCKCYSLSYKLILLRVPRLPIHDCTACHIGPNQVNFRLDETISNTDFKFCTKRASEQQLMRLL